MGKAMVQWIVIFQAILAYGITSHLLLMRLAARASHMQFTPENYLEKVHKLVFDTIFSDINEQLQLGFNSYYNTGLPFRLPRNNSIATLASHIHGNVADAVQLQAILENLQTLGVSSPHFQQALQVLLAANPPVL